MRVIPKMPDSYFQELAERLRRIIDTVGPLPTQRRALIEEFVDQYELGLALELLSETLFDRGTPVEDLTLAEVDRLVELMGLGPEVSIRLHDLKRE